MPGHSIVFEVLGNEKARKKLSSLPRSFDIGPAMMFGSCHRLMHLQSYVSYKPFNKVKHTCQLRWLPACKSYSAFCGRVLIKPDSSLEFLLL